MSGRNDVERRLRRRYKRTKYGTHTMTLSCPLCGEEAIVTEYKEPQTKSSPAAYSVDVDVECDHVEEIIDVFRRVRNKQAERVKEEIEDELEALDNGEYFEPHPADTNSCPYCQRTHDSLYGLINHIEYTHKDRLNRCPYCRKELKNNRGLKYHIVRVHPDEPYSIREVILRVIAEHWGLDPSVLAD